MLLSNGRSSLKAVALALSALRLRVISEPLIMRNLILNLIAGPLFLTLLVCATARAAAPTGEYVFSGKGAMLLTFDASGAYSGVAALPQFGVVNISGTLSGSGGTFVLSDRFNGKTLESGTASGTLSGRGFRMTLGLTRSLSFIGTPRAAATLAPAGLFSAPLPPVDILYQFVPSADAQLVTMQGDQDFFIDLNLALGGQFVFDGLGRGFGVVFENSDPGGTPHWATVRYKRDGSLALRVYTSLFGGKSRALRLAKVSSGGTFDGIYTAVITPDGCVTQSVKITVKDDVISGSDAATGAINGFVDFNGHATFSAAKFTVGDTTCAQAGAHPGTVTFNGDLSNGAFPIIMSGTFIGTGVTGTFVLDQPVGPTGATTTATAARQETWSGTLTGTHVSNIQNGGQWSESYALTLNFPSDLIAALRGKTKILAASGSMSGAETVVTQPPAILDATYVASTLSETAVTVVFAGNLSPNGSIIDLQSTSVLIPSTVHFTTAGKADESENRLALRLHVKHINSTQLKGEWPFGTFVLTKK